MSKILARRVTQTLGVIALTSGLLLVPAVARADIIDTVLGIVAPEYAEAKTVIQCIINKGSFNESVAKACIEEQAKKLVASDPKLKSIVDTVLAAKAGDWVRVVEIVGTDGLKTVVCSGVVSVGGAVKDLVCGAVFQIAKPVIKSALQAVMKGDWWALVALLGPQAACGVIPGGEVKDAICGPLGQALAELGKFVKGGVNAGKDALISFGETISGQTQHMPPEKYYQDYWYFPYALLDVMVVLRGGKPSHKVLYDHCVGYFDSHKAAKSTAEKWCGQMRSQLAAHVNAIVPAIKAAPAAYFTAKLKPQIPEWAVVYYHNISDGKFTGPQLAGACAKDINKLVPIPGPAKYPTEKDLGPPGPYSPEGWACHQAFLMLNQSITAYKQQGMPALLVKLMNAGCKTKKLSVSPKLYAVCDSWEGYAACKTEMTSLGGKGESHCGVDGNVASPKLAKKVAAELGAKRCKFVPGHMVECARPWKQEQCKSLVKQYTGGVTMSWAYEVKCYLKDDPAFLSAKKQAQDILNTLNGVKKVGTVQKPGGKPEGLVFVPPVKVCSHTFDPLAIACSGNPKAPAEAGVALPACAPDPNKDGADAPCYASPYSASAAPTTAKVAAALPGGAPDLTSAAQLVVGGKPASWGGAVAIDAAQARHRADGVCYFATQHTARNVGTAGAGAFTSGWQGGATRGPTRAWPALAANNASTQTDIVALRPGRSSLTLVLDNLNAVTESNEGNNRFKIMMNISGSCDTAPGRATSPPAGRRLSTPSR